MTTLVDGLGREGMRDLLVHLTETEKFTDPVVPLQIRVQQSRISFFDLSLSVQDRYAAMETALSTQRQCIAQFNDHPLRPVWQTDLAETLLTEYLAVVHNSAAQFYEFGVCTAPQKEAFERSVVEALEQLVDADLRLFKLQGDLPRLPDYVDKYENTGTFERLMNKYWKLRTQFYLGHAAYYVTLLPDDHAYFTAEKNPLVLNKLPSAAAEKARLLNLAAQNEYLNKFVADQGDDSGVRMDTAALMGRVQLAQGQAQQAQETLSIVLKAGQPTLTDFTARMGQAVLLDRGGHQGEALEQVEMLKQHTVAKSNLLYFMVLVDLKHRLLLEQARKVQDAALRKAAIASAYQPYLDVITDAALGEQAEQLKAFIFQRWSQNLAQGQDLNQLPAVVPMAIGEMQRQEGQNRMIEALNIVQRAQAMMQASQTQEEEDAALALADTADPVRAEALPILQRSIAINQELLQRDDLSPAIRATTMFNLGVAQYFLDVNDATKIIPAARTLTELADTLPDQPISERAIEYAEAMLRPVDAQQPRPMGVREQYEATAAVLFGKFGTSTVADNARLYYCFNVLIPSSRYREAADILAKVPIGHGTYWESRRERLYCLQNIHRQADAATKAEAGKAALEEARRLIEDATTGLQGASGEQRNLVLDAQANARLVLSDLLLEQGDTAGAVSALEGLEEELLDPSHQDLLRQAQARRIGIYIEAEQVDQMVNAAQRMMTQFPDDAAAIIDRTLDRLEDQIDDLRRRASVELVDRTKQDYLNRSRFLAQAAVRLARQLLDWAQAQPWLVPNDQELAQFRKDNELGANVSDTQAREIYKDFRLLPYRMTYASSLRLSGDAAGALRILEPMLERFPEDPTILHNAAEAYFATDDRNALITKAAPLYSTLISGLQSERPLPWLYWNAWMRWCQISDKVGEGTQDIPFRVRQLAFTDPNLGGEPYKSELTRLKVKYER